MVADQTIRSLEDTLKNLTRELYKLNDNLSRDRMERERRTAREQMEKMH